MKELNALVTNWARIKVRHYISQRDLLDSEQLDNECGTVLVLSKLKK